MWDIYMGVCVCVYIYMGSNITNIIAKEKNEIMPSAAIWRALEMIY